MKRLALSFAAVAALGFGSCEKHSSAELPDHYQHKGSHEAAPAHDTAPAHGEKEKAPAGEHKG